MYWQKEKINWKSGFLWLILLAPLFFIIYGGANTYTSHLPSDKIGEIYYSWEKKIPFLPWTILPYWSIDALYGLSLFLPMTKLMQRQHALRLLVATPIAAIFFVLFPLTFSFVKPESHGVFGKLFQALLGFDKPYNQAPSLHIILLVILWRIYLPHFKSWGKWLWNVWCFLIGISVLTTYQHHFIDIPTGLLVGVIIAYIFPLEEEFLFKKASWSPSKMGNYYAVGFLLTLVIGLLVPIAIGVLFLWISFSLLMISLGYFGLGSKVFQKKANGNFTFASQVLFYPYRVVLKLIRKLFFSTYTEEQKITDQLYLGSYKSSQLTQCDAILDVCCEYPKASDKENYISFPILDLQLPPQEELHKGVLTLNELMQSNTSVLVHCALGLSRSASVIVAWLLYTRQFSSLEECLAFFKNNKYQIHLSEARQMLLKNYETQYCND